VALSALLLFFLASTLGLFPPYCSVHLLKADDNPSVAFFLWNASLIFAGSSSPFFSPPGFGFYLFSGRTLSSFFDSRRLLSFSPCFIFPLHLSSLDELPFFFPVGSAHDFFTAHLPRADDCSFPPSKTPSPRLRSWFYPFTVLPSRISPPKCPLSFISPCEDRLDLCLWDSIFFFSQTRGMLEYIGAPNFT